MKIKILVIAIIGMITGAKAQNWNSTGNNTTTGILTIDGQYIDFNAPVTTGGWARGFYNVAPDKTTKLGGIGMLGSANTPDWYYIAHGATPWNSGLGIYVRTNGNTGIGTTNPQAKLHIESSEHAQIHLKTTSPTSTLGISFKGQRASSILNSSHYIGTDSNSHFNLKIVSDEAIKFQPNGIDQMIISGSGNVGIGTTNPNEKLHVDGRTILESLADAQIVLKGKNTWSGIEFKDVNDRDFLWFNGSHKTFSIGGGGSSVNGKKLHINGGTTIGSSYSSQLVPLNGLAIEGNVGIGTIDTKGFKLGVNGKIAATEVKIATYANWSDFVFEKKYNLPTLTEVENHIKTKGHLQNIPSAEEVKKEGFFLGEMDAKLLQKIEELTLYTIDQEKKLKSQNSKISKLEKENQILKSLLKRVSKLEKQVNNK